MVVILFKQCFKIGPYRTVLITKSKTPTFQSSTWDIHLKETTTNKNNHTSISPTIAGFGTLLSSPPKLFQVIRPQSFLMFDSLSPSLFHNFGLTPLIFSFVTVLSCFVARDTLNTHPFSLQSTEYQPSIRSLSRTDRSHISFQPLLHNACKTMKYNLQLYK